MSLHPYVLEQQLEAMTPAQRVAAIAGPGDLADDELRTAYYAELSSADWHPWFTGSNVLAPVDEELELQALHGLRGTR